MVEYNILGTSPWNTDPFIFKELSPFSGLDSNNVLGFPELESNDRRLSLDDVYPNTPCDDITSSCYSTEGMPFPAASDSLDGTTSDSLEFVTLTWPVDDIARHSSVDLPIAAKNFRNHSESCDPLSPLKSWSRMTSEERLRTVETLTQIISHQMGLREQLEVIRIINPEAVVSTADTEFVVDLSYLDDTKLHRIREYVKKYTSEHPQSIGLFASTASGSSNSSSSNSSTSSSCGSKPSKKELKEQRIQLKAWKQRQRKEHRQLLKERKSGLFMNEQILSLSNGVTPEAEEEVDILA